MMQDKKAGQISYFFARVTITDCACLAWMELKVESRLVISLTAILLAAITTKIIDIKNTLVIIY